MSIDFQDTRNKDELARSGASLDGPADNSDNNDEKNDALVNLEKENFSDAMREIADEASKDELEQFKEKLKTIEVNPDDGLPDRVYFQDIPPASPLPDSFFTPVETQSDSSIESSSSDSYDVDSKHNEIQDDETLEENKKRKDKLENKSLDKK